MTLFSRKIIVIIDSLAIWHVKYYKYLNFITSSQINYEQELPTLQGQPLRTPLQKSYEKLTVGQDIMLLQSFFFSYGSTTQIVRWLLGERHFSEYEQHHTQAKQTLDQANVERCVYGRKERIRRKVGFSREERH